MWIDFGEECWCWYWFRFFHCNVQYWAASLMVQDMTGDAVETSASAHSLQYSIHGVCLFCLCCWPALILMFLCYKGEQPTIHCDRWYCNVSWHISFWMVVLEMWAGMRERGSARITAPEVNKYITLVLTNPHYLGLMPILWMGLPIYVTVSNLG